MTARTFDPVRIGAVNYLNSKPLIEGLRELAGDIKLLLDYPSRLADNLANGQLDVALIPSIECLRNGGYDVVSDACVAARGPVLSVKLYGRKPLADIKTLALDEGSRTSATLARILLSERLGVEPSLEPLPLGLSTEATSADAVLLIGDRAIDPPRETFVQTWDLGEEWYNWTGLPFVFAMWATRSETDLGELDETLGRARDLGVARLAEIARREAPILGISEQTAINYLTKNLYFHLGSAEQNGLRLFHRLAAGLGLADEGVDLVFRDCATAG